MMKKVEKVNLAEKLTRINSYWDPKIVGELNDQYIKLVKFCGEFIWHKHDDEAELFFVIKGSFDMQFRQKTVRLHAGELIIVPNGVEHCPKAKKEVHVLLFEPKTILNTGDHISQRTITNPEKI